jgi:3-mercaptopyruvate sulfurtransferase SseA
MKSSVRLTLPACALLLLAACTPATPTPTVAGLPQTQDDVPRVSPPDALAALESGEAVIVDVRSAQSYAAQHIQGALSIPLDAIEQDPTSVPIDKDKWIITYCT